MNLVYHKLDKEKRNTLIDSLTKYLQSREEIVFAILFGSFNDYDNTVGFRDIDIAIYIVNSKDTFDYALSISGQLSIDFGMSVECIPFNIVSLSIQYRIFRDGTVLFCKDEYLMTGLMEKTAESALDFKYLKDMAIRELD